MKETKKTKILLSILLLSIIIGSATLGCQYLNPNDWINSELKENPNTSDANGGGYVMNTGATCNWEEISSTGTRLDISDLEWDYEDISFISAGWNFTFYETEYDKISVSTNGWMSFPNLGYTDGVIYDIPSFEQNNKDCVALFSAYLSPYIGGDIYYEFLNDSNRLVIEYSQIYSMWGDFIGDFEVIFFENGTIKFQYKNIDNYWEYRAIGLDHGDFTNFNSYTPHDPLSAKAIEFTFNEMIEVDFTFGVNIDNEYSWIITELNDQNMEAYFGIDWEESFGLPQDLSIGMKTKINITNITNNSTDLIINFDTWDWINRMNNFSSISEESNSIEYLKEPLNYTYPNTLPNLFPLILPITSILYISRASLDSRYSYYDGIDETRLYYYDSKDVSGSWINLEIRAEYDSEGVLKFLHIEWYNYTSGESEILFGLEPMTSEFLTSFSFNVQKTDEYSWITTQINNQKMEAYFGTNWEELFGLFPNPTRFMKTKIYITDITDNSSHLTINYDTWDWTYRLDNFSLTSDGIGSIEYLKDPINYTYPNYLPNLFPLITPVPPYFYFKFANLDDHYQYYYDEWEEETNLYYYDSKDVSGSWLYLDVQARYNSKGVLVFLNIQCYNSSSGESGTIFKLEPLTPEFLASPSLGVQENNEYSWIMTQINNQKMGACFGTNWEELFGQFPNPTRFMKTKINISDISSNSTHWTINYDTWDWTYRLDNFSSNSDGIGSIEYLKDPMNYTYPNYLPNLFPLITPIPPNLYFKFANLDESYQYEYSYWDNSTALFYSNDKDIDGDWINLDIRARYDSEGVLSSLKIQLYNNTSGESEIILALGTMTAEYLTTFSLSVQETDEYSWITTQINDQKMESFFGSTWENFFGMFPNPTAGMKTKITITDISDHSTYWTINYDTWDWTYRLDNFSSTSDGIGSIEYLKDPVNYTYPNFLPNFFPLITPIPPYWYFRFANLDDSYHYDYHEYDDRHNLDYHVYNKINGDWIDLYVQAYYNSEGVLISLNIAYYNETDHTHEVIFNFETLTELYTTPFTLGIEEGEQLSWLVSDVDDSLMKTYLGPNWESLFGLPLDSFEMSKMKINITSIEDNSTHWEINYDMWNWIDRSEVYDPVAEDSDSIDLLQDPFYYYPASNFPNIFPLILPSPPSYYIQIADLDPAFYSGISIDSLNPSFIWIEFYINLGGYTYMRGRAQYDELGLLTQLTIELDDYYNMNTTIVLNLVNFNDGPKPSYIGFNEGDIYTYDYYNCTENASNMGMIYFPTDTKRIRNEILFIGGEDLLTESALVIFNLSILDSSDEWHTYSYPFYYQTSAIPIYRNATLYEQMYTLQYSLFFLTGNDVDWETFCDGFKDYYPPEINITFSPLSNGFTVDQTDLEYLNGTLTHYFNYTSSGVLDHWIMYFNGNIFMEVSLNVSDLTIDTIPPNITIIAPEDGQVFGETAPEFIIEVDEINLNSTWYTISGMPDTFIFTENGQIDQSAWSGLSDGTYLLTFYANDTNNNIGFSSINITKDTISPVIEILNPEIGEVFTRDPPIYNIQITEANIDSIWYTLDDGETNIIVTELIGSIDEVIWEALPNGDITIKFYVNDTSGNIAYDSVVVIKSSPGGDPNVSGPSYQYCWYCPKNKEEDFLS